MFIRKQVIFKGDNLHIDYNYQYDVMKNIYRYIGRIDKKIEESLHEKGFEVREGHIFKLFNYTLLFDGAEFNEKNIYVKNNSRLKLILSGEKAIIEYILGGIYIDKELIISNNTFEFLDIADDLYKGRFRKVMLYQAISPIMTKTKDDKGKAVYLCPYEEHFYKNIAENAKKKYRLIYGKDFDGELYFDIDNIDSIRSKSIRLKCGYLVGYLMNIWVETTSDMQKVLYYLGLGQNSSTGFGCLKVVTRR